MKIWRSKRLKPRASVQVDLSKLHQLLTEHFNLEDLRTLCFELNVDYDDLPGEGKTAKARELVILLYGDSRVSELLKIGCEKHSYVPWADVLTADGATPTCLSGLLSKPVVWIAIATLILLGVCLAIWPPQRHPVVAIKTTHKWYVTAFGADHFWLLKAKTDKIREYEEFTLICQERGMVALQTWHKTEEGKHRYVTAMDDQWHEQVEWHWVLRAETHVIDNFEKFSLLDADTGNPQLCSEVVESLKDSGRARVAFQTWHQKEDRHRLVTAMDDTWTDVEELHWVLRAETTKRGDSAKFTLELLRWEWEINARAYAITIGGPLLIILVFLVINWLKPRTSPQLTDTGSESGDENARDEDASQVESNSGG